MARASRIARHNSLFATKPNCQTSYGTFALLHNKIRHSDCFAYQTADYTLTTGSFTGQNRKLHSIKWACVLLVFHSKSSKSKAHNTLSRTEVGSQVRYYTIDGYWSPNCPVPATLMSLQSTFRTPGSVQDRYLMQYILILPGANIELNVCSVYDFMGGIRPG